MSIDLPVQPFPVSRDLCLDSLRVAVSPSGGVWGGFCNCFGDDCDE